MPSLLRGAVVIAAVGFAANFAFALDARVLENGSSAEAAQIGLDAYRKGDKATAVEALQLAAKKGHPIAQWKLGRMYAEGDGIAENQMKAFELFSEVANAYADESPYSRSAPFISSAFVAIGTYYREGIPNSKLKPDLVRARQMYNYAASYFGDADAQLLLAKMYYSGEGGEKDSRQAARWAKLAAEKGNAGAQALLGHLLFEGDGIGRQPILGLMFLTVARERAPDQDWIRTLQEEAFSIATETERRTAMAMADDWQNKNKSIAGSAAPRAAGGTVVAPAGAAPATAVASPAAPPSGRN